MNILSVGCSFLCERGGVKPQVYYLAENLKATLDNRSIPGNGNVHIVYNTIDAIMNSSSTYDLVCIGWSNPGRWDFVTAPHKWFSIKMGNVIPSLTDKPVNIDYTLFRHWAPQVLLLATWLRNKQIPFIMWNSLQTWYEDNTVFHNEIKNIKEFYKPNECHIEMLRMKKEYISPDDEHPNQQSHLDLSYNLLKFYRELYI